MRTLAVAAAVSASVAASPSREWTGATRLVVVCRATTDAVVDQPLNDILCAAVAARAAAGAPLSVAVAQFGDPAMFAPGSVTLLVDAAVRATSDGRLLALSLRSWRVTADDDGDLFGAPPYATRLPAGDLEPALTIAIDAALDTVLPWRRRIPESGPAKQFSSVSISRE